MKEAAVIPSIDKRTFIAAATCLTEGWYALRAPRESPTPGLEWRFFVGAEVGRVARDVLGKGRHLPRSPTAAALEATAEGLADRASALLFEATFTTGPFVARVDAARRNGDSWDLVEIKSGKLPDSRDPKDVKLDYIDDLAFTTFVAQAAGLSIARCIIILIRGDYRYGRPQSELVAELDVRKRVRARAGEFTAIAGRVAVALASPTRPEPALILPCRDCAFFETECIGVGVHDPLFALPRLSAKRLEQLRPYGRISALPEEVDLTEVQQRVAKVIRTGDPLIEAAGLKHLDSVAWPAYYLDFESVGPAIPWFPGTEPYEHMPFQFSMHVCDAPGHETAYYAYLAPNEGDWRRELAGQLVALLGDRGSILMYSPYERRMLTYLADAVPELAPGLTTAQQRLYDLEPIFRNGYCHPGFRGRTSIKETLPTMVPDLSYDTLDVRGGDDAAGLFALLRVGKYSGADIVRHRAGLLEYCKLDTLAMVRLHEVLARIRATVD